MSLHVLFVDDEPNVLSGLRRMLRPQRSRWRMSFANGGQEALELIGRDPVDVVVTDMRMPEMDGAALLNHVSTDYPSTVRIVLSGQSDHERILRVVGPAHQFLSKPCDCDQLVATIDRVHQLCRQLEDESLANIIDRFDQLPSLPPLYKQLVQELRSDEVALDRVAELISTDVAMSAKILQLVNSSFFGVSTKIACPKQAASMLGISVLRPLVLLAGVFVQYEGKNCAKTFSLNNAVQHALSVAVLASRIGRELKLSPEEIDSAYIAGMMHDLGKIVLAVQLPERYEEIVQLQKDPEVSWWQAERECLGTSHAEIAAYLLALWGLPNRIAEVVAYHHEPSAAPGRDNPVIDALTAVHLANGLAHQHEYASEENSVRPDQGDWDRDYLSLVGINPEDEAMQALLETPEVRS